ncbi:hypothetical protein K1719_027270 [Acacia pycnantha]|nr:hypothetical protein K1719_027270 [Acacia pycnantha]
MLWWWIVGLFLRQITKQNAKLPKCRFCPLQDRRFRRLQERLLVPFDETRPDHQEALRALWHCSNPSTVFRGCGFISVENLLFHAITYPASFLQLLHEKDGKRSPWEYPFAVAGINISFMLIKLLDLCSGFLTFVILCEPIIAYKSESVAGTNFIKFLKEDEEAFDVLYCIAFDMNASYMNFNEVLQTTPEQLERDLSLECIHRIRNLPAYSIL